MTVYVLLWESEHGGQWDVWSVHKSYEIACAEEERLQKKYQDRTFFIFTETLED